VLLFMPLVLAGPDERTMSR